MVSPLFSLSTDRRIRLCLLVLGITSVCTQMIMLREAMSVLGGNELIIGMGLGVWLLLSAIGSGLGAFLVRRFPGIIGLFAGHLSLAILPIGQLIGIRSIPLWHIPGLMLGFNTVVMGMLLVLLPVCLIAGGMIPLAAIHLTGRRKGARAYVIDTWGDLIGGLLFSLVFVFWVPHWTTLVITGCFNVFVALLILPPGKSAVRWGKTVSSMMLIGLLVSPSIQMQTLKWQYPDQDLITIKNTSFACLAITRLKEQLNVYLDGTWYFTSDDPRPDNNESIQGIFQYM